MSKMVAVVIVVAGFHLANGKPGTPRQRTIPALTRSSESVLKPNTEVYCDTDHYCDGGTCCPDFNGGFLCADGDMWANCFIEDNSYFCPGDFPIICGDVCCDGDDVCSDGECFTRSTVANGHQANVSTSIAGHPNMQLTRGTPPLGWYPDISSWSDGMLHTAHVGLHNMFLAVKAQSWRKAGPNSPGQCYVIGFPADLGSCTNPWDDGCKGSEATIIQDGKMTLYNTDPVLSLVAQEKLDWCNDDPHEPQVQAYKYTYKETQTVSFTVGTMTKIGFGVKSKTTVAENLEIEKAGQELEFDFSAEVDVSTSHTQTTTTEKDWEQDLTVTVGPRSHVYSECALSQGLIDSPYDLKVKLHTPIVWACTLPEDGPTFHDYPEDPSYWQSFNIEQEMERSFGFNKTDLEKILSAKTGGTFKAVMGQKVVCNTHTVPMKDGESCKPRNSNANATSILV